MTLKVVFRPVARDEFVEAAARYEGQRTGLGAKFIAEVERCVRSAAEHPELYQAIYKGVRRVAAKRFPYCVYFRPEREAIVILAVFHGSREPAQWQQRA